VIAVGPGAPNKEGQVVPTSVKAGDRVLLPGWGGNAIKVGEEVRAFFCFFWSSFGWMVDFCFVFYIYRNTSFLRMRRFWLRLRSRVESACVDEWAE
jgi:hypothetical protein